MASDADGKNLHSLICQRCQSVILRNGHGDFVPEKQIDLPSVSVKKAQVGDGTTEYESFTEWWQVGDVMTFENVGVTNAKDSKRYLCCADCELGPIGVQIDNDYYLAVKRVDPLQN